MDKLKSFVATTVRWGWFGLLVLVAFGYLVAGLSSPPKGPNQEGRGETVSESAESDQWVSGGKDSTLATSIDRLNSRWLASLAEQGMEPAPIADWMTICRRMSLAMVGSGMSLEEIRQLERLPAKNRESAHLRNLLRDSRAHHYWAERWTRFLVGTDGGQFISYRRRRFRIWLAEAFAENRRYDQMVRQLITAEGLFTDQPEVNFLTATFNSNNNKPDPVRLAARTSRAFLGLRIDCLQCHDDFLGNVNLGDVGQPREGRQTDFHQLAAFYTSAKSGLRGVRSGKADYKYKYLDADEEVDVQPAVPYSPDLLPWEGNDRVRLARWVTHPKNRQAARAAVSHVWALMFGRPAGEAVDNLPLDSDCGPILETLVDEFVEHDFDIRYLIRVIVGSGPFRVDSRARFEVTQSHEQFCAVFPLVQLRPEQVAGSVIQAARVKRTDRESSLFLQLQTQAGTNDFVKRYGDIGEDEFTTDSVTITQRLLMMNGKMLTELIKSSPVLNASGHVDMFAASDESAVETIYLCSLNRYPSVEEMTRFVERLTEAKDRGAAIEDMMWVLCNSSEMAWNH